MSQDNVKVVRSLYEYYGRKDIEAAAALVSDDFEWIVMPFGQTVTGQEGFKQMFGGFGIPFPDSTINVKNSVDGGDCVVMEYDFAGTHNGPLTTPAGEIPATGKPINIPGCEVYQLRHGKIVRLHTYFDVPTMMQQIGFMPSSA
jgi:steroid delta-isomerase-like uncharacterized protein